jgi:hypothetical protein
VEPGVAARETPSAAASPEGARTPLPPKPRAQKQARAPHSCRSRTRLCPLPPRSAAVAAAATRGGGAAGASAASSAAAAAAGARRAAGCAAASSRRRVCVCALPRKPNCVAALALLAAARGRQRACCHQ